MRTILSNIWDAWEKILPGRQFSLLCSSSFLNIGVISANSSWFGTIFVSISNVRIGASFQYSCRYITSLLNYVPQAPSCLTCLCAFVPYALLCPTCLRALCALLTHLTCAPCPPSFSCALHALFVRLKIFLG